METRILEHSCCVCGQKMTIYITEACDGTGVYAYTLHECKREIKEIEEDEP